VVSLGSSSSDETTISSDIEEEDVSAMTVPYFLYLRTMMGERLMDGSGEERDKRRGSKGRGRGAGD